MFTRLLKIALSQPVTGGGVTFTGLAHRARLILELFQKKSSEKMGGRGMVILKKSEYPGWNPCDVCRCKNKV